MSLGDLSGMGTPGPISNPEVKHVSADGTWRATSWESRSLPRGFSKTPNVFGRGKFFYLAELVKNLGVSVIVTDDLASYRNVAEKLNLGHQVCQFHVRRWVGKALKELRETVPKDWQWILDEIEQLIEFLPPDGDSACMPCGNN